jgi:hypothetical protein
MYVCLYKYFKGVFRKYNYRCGTLRVLVMITSKYCKRHFIHNFIRHFTIFDCHKITHIVSTRDVKHHFFLKVLRFSRRCLSTKIKKKPLIQINKYIINFDEAYI